MLCCTPPHCSRRLLYRTSIQLSCSIVVFLGVRPFWLLSQCACGYESGNKNLQVQRHASETLTIFLCVLSFAFPLGIFFGTCMQTICTRSFAGRHPETPTSGYRTAALRIRKCLYYVCLVCRPRFPSATYTTTMRYARMRNLAGRHPRRQRPRLQARRQPPQSARGLQGVVSKQEGGLLIHGHPPQVRHTYPPRYVTPGTIFCRFS